MYVSEQQNPDEWETDAWRKQRSDNRINVEEARIRSLSEKLIRVKRYTKRDRICRRINKARALILAIKLAQ